MKTLIEKEKSAPIARVSCKRILFVTSLFPPDNSVGTLRIVKFIKYLKRNGWDVHVLTLKEKHFAQSTSNYQEYLAADVHVYRGGKIDFFAPWEWLKKHIRRDAASANGAEGGAVASTPPPDERLSFFANVKDFVTRMLQYPDRENGFIFHVFFKTLALLKRHEIPYVFLSSPPHSLYLPINLLRRFRRFTYIVDFRDPWGRSQWGSVLKTTYQRAEKRLDLYFERQTIRSADVIIFNTPALKEDFARYYQDQRLAEKSYVITNGFDPDFRDRPASRPKNSRNGKSEKIVLLHTGTLYKKRDPRTIFEGLKLFRQSHPQRAARLELVFIGGLAEEFAHLNETIREEGLADNIILQPSIPYEQVLERSRNADWLILLQPGTKIQIPAKFFDYILVNRPIWGVVEKDSVGERMIRELGIGQVSDCRSPESIAQFFEQITSRKPPVFSPREAEIMKYSVPSLVQKLETILAEETINV